jgi:DNA-directed RNA polymerase subunit K/omega
MFEDRVFLDDIYASEHCEGSAFKAVVMMAREARFINEQAQAGFIELEVKPTTIAMNKFKQNRLRIDDGVRAPKEEIQESAEDVLAAQSLAEEQENQEQDAQEEEISASEIEVASE